MSYIAPSGLTPWPGGLEVAQVATPAGSKTVAADLMDAVLTGADTSDWSTEEVAVATRALARVSAATGAANQLVDSYLMPRYRAFVPFSNDVLAQLQAPARAVARYMLHQNLRRTDARSDDGQHPIHADYDDAKAYLAAVRDGKLSLGLDDPAPVDASTGSDWNAGDERVFARSARSLP